MLRAANHLLMTLHTYVCVLLDPCLCRCMGLCRCACVHMCGGYPQKSPFVSLRQIPCSFGLHCAGWPASELQGAVCFCFLLDGIQRSIPPCCPLFLTPGLWGSVLCGSAFLTELAPQSCLYDFMNVIPYQYKEV